MNSAEGCIKVRRKYYPFIGSKTTTNRRGNQPYSYSGLTIEIPRKNTFCMKCGVDLVKDEPILGVFKQRGTESASKVLYFHTECLLSTFTVGHKGKCIICSKRATLMLNEIILRRTLDQKDPRRTTKRISGSRYGRFHRECIEEFISKNIDWFDVNQHERLQSGLIQMENVLSRNW